MSPLLVAWLACAAVAGSCWLLSVVTREYSWVDRIWSIVPPLYVVYFAWCADWADPRLSIMSALTLAWGARLTFNFARKGGYQPGGEDYRWAELRTRMSALAFQVFNVFFIASYQNVLLALIAMPAWIALEHTGAPLGPLDAIATVLFVALLVLETLADDQQWRFHQEKKAKRERGEPITEPFLTRGLFRYSRHPNFFAEQGQWWALYLFSVAAGGGWLNPSIVGPVLLTLLFHGSTRFTEELSKRKYPEYAEYQRTTSRLVPWMPRP